MTAPRSWLGVLTAACRKDLDTPPTMACHRSLRQGAKIMHRIVVPIAQRLLPPTALTRRLALQSLLYASGEGAFLTGSAVYFTQVVGLRATQVGLGLTVAAAVSFLVAYPAGWVVDLIGARTMWVSGALSGAVMFGLWPFITGFGAYVAMVTMFEIVSAFGATGRRVYTLDVVPHEERVQAQAHVYSTMNVGFTLGALVGGVALALDTTVLRWAPLFSMTVGLVNSSLIGRLPRTTRGRRADTPERPPDESAVAGHGPTRNVGWMAVSLFNGTLWTNSVLLNVVIPLWLVEATDAPHWLLAFLFGTNTVLCVLLPTRASRGVDSVTSGLRAARVSAVFFVVSCLITAVTDSTAGVLTVVLVWLGHVAVTGAELYAGAAGWAFQSNLMESSRRGEYVGIGSVFNRLGSGWAPALFTFLALDWHPTSSVNLGWLVIAAIVVTATVALHPSARLAERFVELAGRRGVNQAR